MFEAMLSVTWYYFLGLLAGTTIGIASLYQNSLAQFFEFSPFNAGLAVSLVTFIGAVTGYFVGLIISKLSAHLVLSGGLLFSV